MNLNQNIIKYAFRAGLWLCLILTGPSKVSSQVWLVTGYNYNTIRHDVDIENVEPRNGWQIGGAVRYFPLKAIPKLSLQNEVLYNVKGYEQHLDQLYDFKFAYIASPILINYKIASYLTLTTGVEPSLLVSTNVEQGMDTYNHFDCGISAGLSAFETKRLCFYTRFTYGLLPMLDYYSIDEVGNFTGEIHDIKNMTLTIGLKIQMYHEEFILYK